MRWPVRAARPRGGVESRAEVVATPAAVHNAELGNGLSERTLVRSEEQRLEFAREVGECISETWILHSTCRVLCVCLTQS